MISIDTSFDALLATAHDLAITIVTGQLGPLTDGRMWIDHHSLDSILCPDYAERQVALLIAPGGSGETTIHIGRRILAVADLDRLAQNSAAAGGSLTLGRLAVLTPELWLARHAKAAHNGDPAATLAAAIAAGWPASCENNPVIFLDDVPLYALLAQANVGRTVTLLVATLAAPLAQPLGVAPPGPTEQPHPTYRLNDRGAVATGVDMRVVQQDVWERPRIPHAPAPSTREPTIGDRIVIRQGRRPIPSLLNRVGTVVEIFRVPRDSCMVRVDGDGEPQREWFCYHDEVVLSTA